jgi:hypothetical protein
MVSAAVSFSRSRTSSSKFSSSFVRVAAIAASISPASSACSASKAAEGRPDLLGLPAALIDVGDPPLEVDAGADRPEHLVRGAEDPLEERELLVEQFIDPAVGLVAAVQEVHDHDVVFLPVTVASPDPLLDPLRVPREVIVHNERAELQVDALSSSLGCDHQRPALAEIVDERLSHVGRPRTGHPVGAAVAFDPFLVNCARPFVSVRPVEEHDAVAPGAVGEQVQ